MFNSYNDLRGFRIRAADQPEGSLDDIYFDDHDWRVRYVVAGLGFWIFGRQGLIGVGALGKPDLDRRELPVSITAEQLREAPETGAHAPVSAQEEMAAEWEEARWPPFLLGGTGPGYTPILAEEQIATTVGPRIGDDLARRPTGDPHLRSMNEVIGYHVAANDGDVGTVADFLINPLDWKVRYYVIDTGHWLPGRQVVLATDWTKSVDWEGQKVVVDVPRHKIETSPEPEEVGGLTRSEEERLYRHYEASFYWV